MANKKNKKYECPEGNIHRKNFVELLDKVARNKSRWDVFNDFLQFAAITLNNVKDAYYLQANKDIIEERNKRLKKVLNEYNAESKDYLSSMLDELIEELETYCQGNYTDVLGEIFHQLNFQKEWKGQFFTPQHVSTMSGRMIVGKDGMERTIKEKGFVTINEPCCGAGAMIYGFANGVYNQGFNPCKDILIFADDIDERCVMMTFIQCSLYGFPAIVSQRNTLIGNILSEPWYTPVFVVDGWVTKTLKLWRG